jgi:hypothetical protein
MTSRGVFKLLTQRAAFFDSLILVVRGQRRKDVITRIRLGKNRPIGSARSNYARAIDGVCRWTKTEFQLRYGRFHRFKKNVAPFCLTFESQQAPITSHVAQAIVDALFCKGAAVTVTKCDVAFDTNLKKSFILRSAVCRGCRYRYQSTTYFGSPTSAFQVRVYQKGKVVRIEMVLRKRKLVSLGVQRLDDLKSITHFDLASHFELRRHRRGVSLGRRGVPQGASMSKLQRVCKKEGMSFRKLSARCRQQKRLLRMLRNLVW